MEPAEGRLLERDRQDSPRAPCSIEAVDRSEYSGYRGRRGIKIETLALPGEDPTELRALLDQWYAAYQPVSPAEWHLVDMAVWDLIQIRRCRRCQEAVEEKLTREIRNRWWIDQENQVEKLKTMLAHQPAAAVAELKRFASGCAWLIDCWTWLESLVEKEGAALDGVREELEVFDADGTNRKVHGSDETDCLTRVYCLLAQREPTERDIQAFYRTRNMFPDEGHLPCSVSLPPRWQCRRRVRAVVGRELPPLRALYEKLQIEYDPSAHAAAVKKAHLRDPHRARVLRARRQSEKSFHVNYKLLLEIRKDFAAPSDLPGKPVDTGPRKQTIPGKRPRAGA
jgi:hypothetical protein